MRGRHKRNGHLFQNRYKSIVCQEDKYLLEPIRYLIPNPLRAGLVKDISELNNYAYSSHHVLIGKRSFSWQKNEEVLSLFGRTKNLAKRNYLKFVSNGISNSSDLDGGGFFRSTTISDVIKAHKEKGVFDERILGDSEFVERLLPIESLKYKIKPKVKITARELIEETANLFKISTSDLKGFKRTKASSNAGAVISFGPKAIYS